MTVWFDPSTPWHAAPSGKRGAQPVYGEAAIRACPTLKVPFGLGAIARAIDGVDGPAYGVAMCQGGGCEAFH